MSSRSRRKNTSAKLGFSRADRVGQQIQQELGTLLLNDVKDPRIGFVTVTEVRLTHDLRYARVFVSVYGEPESRQDSIDGLQAAAGFLKRELGRRLALRFMPELEFRLDESLDTAARLQEVLGAIASGEKEAPSLSDAPEFAKAHHDRSDRLDVEAALSEQRAQATQDSRRPTDRPQKGRSKKNRRSFR